MNFIGREKYIIKMKGKYYRKQKRETDYAAIKKGLKQVVLTLGVAVGILYASEKLTSSSGDYLKIQDFEKAKKIEFYNENGRIWTPYMNEKIAHNQSNWNLYSEQVKKMNNGKLEGTILLPDLDNDGKVGK